MSDLVGNPEYRFSQIEAHILHRCVIVILYFQVATSGNLNFDNDDETDNIFPTTNDQDIDNIIAEFWDDLECAKVLYRETTNDSFIMVCMYTP